MARAGLLILERRLVEVEEMREVALDKELLEAVERGWGYLAERTLERRKDRGRHAEKGAQLALLLVKD